MALKGKRTKIERWIHARPCVVRVEVDAIIPDADPSEPSNRKPCSCSTKRKPRLTVG
jgi:hypothetical protein